MLRFGLSLPCTHPIGQPAWPDDAVVAGVEQVARKADALGYDYLSCCDHSVIPKKSQKFMGARWFDAISTLSFVGGMTSRIRLLSSVMVLPYRSPFDIAKAFGTMDAMTNGRVILGVGVGHLRPEFRSLGANYEDRGAVTDEMIEVIKALWSADAAEHHGRFWDFEPVMVAPRPATEKGPPIWVGGSTQRSARRAGLLGDGWHPFAVSHEQFAAGVVTAREAAAKAGRDDALDFSIGVGPVAPTTVAPITGSQSGAGNTNLDHLTDADGPSDVRKAAPGLTADSLTTTDAVAMAIRQKQDAGATVIGVGFRYEELSPLLESMDWFAQEVMPQFA